MTEGMMMNSTTTFKSGLRRGAVVVTMLALLISSAACKPPADESSSEVEATVERAAPVRVSSPEQLTLPRRATYSGTLEAWEVAQITGQQGTRIERMLVQEGDRVRRGQVLARMDDATLRQAQVELRTAKTELDRAKRLVDIGAMARQQLEQAQAAYDSISTNIELLRSNTVLTSPIEGMVTHRYFVAGEQFVAGAQTPSLLTVQQLDPLKVIIDVAERYFPQVKMGMKATVNLDTYPGEDFAGEVTRINPTISPDSRSFRVEIRLDNEDGRLSPGMSARASLELGEVEGLFVVRSALQTQPGRDEPFVWVVQQGKAHRAFIEAGERFEDRQLVRSGLEPDAQVVTEGMSRLNEGTEVEVVGAPEGQSEQGDEVTPEVDERDVRAEEKAAEEAERADQPG
ncbi:efflux RND transporter periplasmic adaptor subunit [Bradymonadaceae bacterium TMQ3]|uniref:Efflux RND transporter periplasmic adaptor subunit n=1 Tax=Lujinxingia sediminis TaxID=2480984 RepID=A0ABY0CXE9_9DELT|nr:efflux RND transporter periplasmic adaptor subunit [Lujinxingia sediminis]RDV39645.1 efflux RND transporter periplasmic adaptor subunit [Bradymonadaceae bacterium TMQ3]RVU48310.1 efflux RND transporter periplasmic adaptor subunit [Lujinxingia sediminis]TXC77610.1 efflux RND transporter periplasmic adaptor subunit [Bradymonadales bacterium TMQ1]